LEKRQYEDIYLKAYGSMAEVKEGLATYFQFIMKNVGTNFNRKTPAMVTSALYARNRLRHEQTQGAFPTYEPCCLSEEPRPPLTSFYAVITW